MGPEVQTCLEYQSLWCTYSSMQKSVHTHSAKFAGTACTDFCGQIVGAFSVCKSSFGGRSTLGFRGKALIVLAEHPSLKHFQVANFLQPQYISQHASWTVSHPLKFPTGLLQLSVKYCNGGCWVSLGCHWPPIVLFLRGGWPASMISTLLSLMCL